MKNKKLVATLAFAVLASVVPAAAASATTVEATQVVKAEKAKHAADRVLVKMKQGKADGVAAIEAKHNAKEDKAFKGNGEWKLLKVPNGKVEEVLADLANDPSVELAEPDYVMHALAVPNDPSYSSQYHLPKISAPAAWDIAKGSSAITVAIIDTGIDIQHADLSAKIVPGYDFVNLDTNADDDQGHGTHCAGIAAAGTNNGLNGAGVDWNAKLMPVKVLDAGGSGYTSDIISGVNWASANGAKVLSMSLGGGGASTAFQDAINAAWNSGKIIVAAAGNSNTSTKSYPAAYNNVVAVASTTSTDARSSFSNYGTWVDIAAPGSSIYSTANGGGMTTMSGTSMACPVVAGSLSLLWSKNPGATNAAVVSRLMATADKITGTGTNWVAGRVNLYNAVNGF